MALWGTANSIYSPGTVTIDYANKTITGSGTSFTNATVGSVITIGVGATFGEAVISGITSATLISIATTQYLSGAPTPAGVGYTMSQKPVYLLEDSHYALYGPAGVSTIATVQGVDIYETEVRRGTVYEVTHAGWVGVQTYIDMHGNLRVKKETVVAFSGITTGITDVGAPFGDADDDVFYPDTLITITAQPQSLVGIATTATGSFSVTATRAPQEPALTFQWQFASSVGAGFTNLTNADIYSNVTTATLGIAATTTTAKDGFYYRVVVSATGAESVVSAAASLTYA
jgi:hypothetical protein